MTRIAHFIDTLESGGAERMVVNLCQRQTALGHTVEVLHFGNEWITAQARGAGFSESVLPRESWYSSKLTVAGFAVALASVLRRRHFELLHSHLFGAVTAGAVAAVLAGVPHVGTLHDVYFVAEQPRRFKLLRLAAALGSQLVAVSEDMRRFYRRLSSRKCTFELVYNGVDASLFAPALPRDDRPFTLVSIGRLVAIKGFDVLLDALAMTGPTEPVLQIAGIGEDLGALQQRVAKLGLAQRVRFLGFCDDVGAVLAQADAFVLASRSEGLSCSVVEAMAAAVPCVITDVGGNRELVVNGETGFLVPSEDPAALAASLTVLAGDRAHARIMGAAARRRVERQFSLDATVRGYEEIYRALLPPVSPSLRLGT